MTTTTGLRRWLPLALAAGLALTGCGTKVAGGAGSGGTSLPVLHVGERLGAADTVGSSRDADPYPLVGTLPTGPDEAPVYRYGDARTDESVAVDLAAAFGISGTPQRHAHGWVVTAKDASVVVTDGDAAWSFTRALNGCFGMPVDVDNLPGTATSAVGCAIDAITASPAPPPGGTAGGGGPAADPAPADLSDARALDLARPILTALGLDPAGAAVAAGSGPVRWVTWDPTIDGTRSTGATTTLMVDASGVVGAQGVHASPAAGPAYPIISATAALDWLRAQPQPEIAIACVQGKVCPGIGPKKVTGATLGLMSAYDDATRVLVPAWFFSIEGTDLTTPVIAVDSAFLAAPTSSGTSGSGGATAEPGSTGSGSAVPDPGSTFTPIPPDAPAPPASPPPYPASTDVRKLPVQSATLGKDGTTLVLHAMGSMCEDFRATADESATDVRVTVTAAWNKGTTVSCPAMARAIDLPVTLSAPWDNRTVIDTSNDQPVAVS
jgi:hypothetical protein